MWLGADVSAIAKWFLDHRTAVQARSACWSVGCCARCRRAGNRDDVSAVVASAA
jgi:hypothetical protein